MVQPEITTLVRLRNQAARKLGFKDYHVMQLALGEQSQEQVLRLFDELDALTREPFHAAKAEIDAVLAEQLRHRGRRAAALALPRSVLPGAAGGVRRHLDGCHAGRHRSSSAASSTRASACRSTTCSARSDLYEKKGKNPHAFCTDIDRAGRRPRAGQHRARQEWLGTMLHELGHSVYSSKNIPPSAALRACGPRRTS